jgi:hypothetical protein
LARATWVEARLPFAVGWFSITTGWPSASERRSANALATKSPLPPAAVVTTSWMGREG